jgi:hypothetical protein
VLVEDGRIVAAECEVILQAGAFPGSPVLNGCMCAYAPYAIENVEVIGYDVVSNRPKAAAYRAPGSPIAAFGVSFPYGDYSTTINVVVNRVWLQQMQGYGDDPDEEEDYDV